MRSSHDDRTRQWIEAVSDTSLPIQLDDVMGDQPDADGADPVEPPLIDQLNWEEPMRNNRALAALAVAALIVVAGIALFVVGGDGDGVSTELDTPTGPADDAENTEQTVNTVATVVPATPLEAAIVYWEALSSGDREATRAAIDPAAHDSAAPMPFGRAESVDGMLDWYEAVDWAWQFERCAEQSDQILCTAGASNAWSQAIGLPPITGTFVVVVGEDGVTSVADAEESFVSQWGPLVFSPFSDWVATNHPDEAETMFGTPGDVTPEIIDLYRVNTERFVDAPR